MNKWLGLCCFLGWLPSMVIMTVLGACAGIPPVLMAILVGGTYYFGWAITVGTLEWINEKSLGSREEEERPEYEI